MAFKTSHQLFRVCLWPQETGRHQVPSSGSAAPLPQWLADRPHRSRAANSRDEGRGAHVMVSGQDRLPQENRL